LKIPHRIVEITFRDSQRVLSDPAWQIRPGDRLVVPLTEIGVRVPLTEIGVRVPLTEIGVRVPLTEIGVRVPLTEIGVRTYW
jgi:hypothetical protein